MLLNPQTLICRIPCNILLIPITICIIPLPTLQNQRQHLRVGSSEIALKANFLSDPFLSPSVLPPLIVMQVTEEILFCRAEDRNENPFPKSTSQSLKIPF